MIKVYVLLRKYDNSTNDYNYKYFQINAYKINGELSYGKVENKYEIIDNATGSFVKRFDKKKDLLAFLKSNEWKEILIKLDNIRKLKRYEELKKYLNDWIIKDFENKVLL